MVSLAVSGMTERRSEPAAMPCACRARCWRANHKKEKRRARRSTTGAARRRAQTRRKVRRTSEKTQKSTAARNVTQADGKIVPKDPAGQTRHNYSIIPEARRGTTDAARRAEATRRARRGGLHNAYSSKRKLQNTRSGAALTQTETAESR